MAPTLNNQKIFILPYNKNPKRKTYQNHKLHDKISKLNNNKTHISSWVYSINDHPRSGKALYSIEVSPHKVVIQKQR